MQVIKSRVKNTNFKPLFCTTTDALTLCVAEVTLKIRNSGHRNQQYRQTFVLFPQPFASSFYCFFVWTHFIHLLGASFLHLWACTYENLLVLTVIIISLLLMHSIAKPYFLLFCSVCIFQTTVCKKSSRFSCILSSIWLVCFMKHSIIKCVGLALRVDGFGQREEAITH